MELDLQALDNMIPFDEDVAQPTTPQPANMTLQEAIDGRIKASAHLTPPPSTQITRTKERTPTPTYSSISTPPPTIETSQSRIGAAFAATMSSEQIASSSIEDLRTAMIDLQSAYQAAKTSAAHYKLQYEMLAQEMGAAMERLDVEARMAQHENDIIHIAEQAKAAAPPLQAIQDGMMPVQKDLYQGMCLEIQNLTRLAAELHYENRRQEKVILGQENEISSLSDKVSMMRERIRANREHVNHYRRQPEQTPYSLYTPGRPGHGQFAALLQASEIASQEAASRRKKVTMTPQRYKAPPYTTPTRPVPYNMPATAPVARTEFLAYTTPTKSKQPPPPPPPPRSEETVSNSDRDEDSEAETEILDDSNVGESQASRAASLMLRQSQETFTKPAPPKMRQTRLFGAVSKPVSNRHDDGPSPSKKARTAGGIGLGIVNARH